MNEACSRDCPFRLAVKSLAELLLVAAGTVALLYGLEQLAEYRAQWPMAADAQGTVILAVPHATIRGNVSLAPRVLEEQKSDFAPHYGRDLAKERDSRFVRHWSGSDSSVSWRFETRVVGEFDIQLECAADPQEAGGEFEVTVGSERLTATVSPTGGADAWQTVSVGHLRLPTPGVYTLAIKPIQVTGKTLMGLKEVVLRKYGP